MALVSTPPRAIPTPCHAEVAARTHGPHVYCLQAVHGPRDLPLGQPCLTLVHFLSIYEVAKVVIKKQNEVASKVSHWDKLLNPSGPQEQHYISDQMHLSFYRGHVLKDRLNDSQELSGYIL